MGKLDDLRRMGGANVAESTGARGAGLPPGLDPNAAVGLPARLQGLSKEKGAARIPIDRIERDPDQPREDFEADALDRLADSLRTRGQLQPIRVRWDEGRGVYVILLGERRWRAAKLAGLTELSCVIHGESIEPDEKLAIQVVENALREDLKPVEQAKAFRALMGARGWTTRELAAELHVGQASVVRALSLLDLTGTVRARVEKGDLAPSVAYEVAKLENPEDQEAVAAQVVASGLKRAEVAELVGTLKARRPAEERPTRTAPIRFDLGDGSVTVRWKRGNASAVQMLREALRRAQEAEDADEAA